MSSSGSGAGVGRGGRGRRRAVLRQGHGRQRHRRQAVVRAGDARPVAGAEGRPAVEDAGRGAGGAHRQRADRGVLRQRPQLAASPPGRRRSRSGPGTPTTTHPVGRRAGRRRRGRAAAGPPAPSRSASRTASRTADAPGRLTGRRPGRAEQLPVDGDQLPRGGVPRPASPPACRGRPRPARRARAGSASTRSTASASAAASPTGTSSAASPSSSGRPPARVATSGVPDRSASWAVSGPRLPARGQHAQVGGAEQVGDVVAPAEQQRRAGARARIRAAQLVLAAARRRRWRPAARAGAAVGLPAGDASSRTS